MQSTQLNRCSHCGFTAAYGDLVCVQCRRPYDVSQETSKAAGRVTRETTSARSRNLWRLLALLVVLSLAGGWLAYKLYLLKNSLPHSPLQ